MGYNQSLTPSLNINLTTPKAHLVPTWLFSTVRSCFHRSHQGPSGDRLGLCSLWLQACLPDTRDHSIKENRTDRVTYNEKKMVSKHQQNNVSRNKV